MSRQGIPTAAEIFEEMAEREREWDRVFRMLDRVTRGPFATFVAWLRCAP